MARMTSYDLIALPAPKPVAGRATEAYDLNTVTAEPFATEVVGRYVSPTRTRACVWTVEANRSSYALKVVALPSSADAYATSISDRLTQNAASAVGGFANLGAFVRAVVWQRSQVGGSRTLNEFNSLLDTGRPEGDVNPGGNAQCYALVSAGGMLRAAGSSDAPGGRTQAVRWYLSSTGFRVEALATATQGDSQAFSLNRHGHAAGWHRRPSSQARAALWRAVHQDAPLAFADLGTLGGASSVARCLSDSNSIVGSSETAAGIEHACQFFHLALHGRTFRRDLDGDANRISVALGVNGLNQVVGWMRAGSGGQQAFFWSAEEGMQPLTARLNEAKPPRGLRLLEATAINEAGAILCNGTLNRQRQAFLLVPAASRL